MSTNLLKKCSCNSMKRICHSSSARPRRHTILPSRINRQQRGRGVCPTRASYDADGPVEDEFEDDFYSILGVDPGADVREIKLAYYGMMRECHPDTSVDDGDLSTEICVLLNEIYETLSDPERRTMYDEVAGFSGSSVNPFMDGRYPPDQVFVDELSCIGCRNCNNVCPKTFGMEEEWGRARAMKQNVDPAPKLQEAIDTCPVNCIHWVSAPQLSLLDSALARMERPNVVALMGSGSSGRDVFSEASMAWEKRRAEARSRAAAAAAVASSGGNGGWWSSFMAGAGPANGTYSTGRQGSGRKAAQGDKGSASGTGNNRAARDIASLAAKVSRAARTMTAVQELNRRSRVFAALQEPAEAK